MLMIKMCYKWTTCQVILKIASLKNFLFLWSISVCGSSELAAKHRVLKTTSEHKCTPLEDLNVVHTFKYITEGQKKKKKYLFIFWCVVMYLCGMPDIFYSA